MATFRLRLFSVALLAGVSSAQAISSASQTTDSATQDTASDSSLPGTPDTGLINSWHGVTFTNPASTHTVIAKTTTYTAEEVNQEDGLPGVSYPGVGVRPYSTSTIPALTATLSPTTVTIAASTAVFTLPPDILANQLLGDYIYDLLDLAPSITSVPVAMASKANVDYLSFFNSYTSAHPVPAIESKLFSDLRPLYQVEDPVSMSLYNAIINNLIVYPYPSQTASLSSVLSSILAPYPSLSSEIRQWQTEIRNWGGPEYLAELQLLTSDLSITNPNPTFLSVISAAAVEATATSNIATSSTSKAGAVATAHASVLVNAGLAAAGMALVGLM